MFDELQLARLCFLDLILRQRQREFALNVNKAREKQEQKPQPQPQRIPPHRRFWHRSSERPRAQPGRGNAGAPRVTAPLES